MKRKDPQRWKFFPSPFCWKSPTSLPIHINMPSLKILWKTCPNKLSRQMIGQVGLEVPLRLLVNFQAGSSEQTSRTAIDSLFIFSLPTSHCSAPTQLGIVDSDLHVTECVGLFPPRFSWVLSNSQQCRSMEALASPGSSDTMFSWFSPWLSEHYSLGSSNLLITKFKCQSFSRFVPGAVCLLPISPLPGGTTDVHGCSYSLYNTHDSLT